MESELIQLGVKLFGPYAITVAILLWWIRCLLGDAKKDRDERNRHLQQFLEVMGRVEAYLLIESGRK